MSSSTKPLREVVQQLAETFNDPKIRELSYFDFYDDSLTIYGFPPNLPANKEGLKQFIYEGYISRSNFLITVVESSFRNLL